MKHIAALTLMTICAGLTVGSLQAQKNAAVEKAVRDNEAQWNKDWASKDADKILAHYSDDAMLMSPGSPPASGKEAIRGALKQMLDDPALSLKFEATRVHVAKSGDVAWTEGTYNLTMTDPGTKKPFTDKGTYVTVYKKQADGSWKAVSDIASSGTMPGAPPAQ